MTCGNPVESIGSHTHGNFSKKLRAAFPQAQVSSLFICSELYSSEWQSGITHHTLHQVITFSICINKPIHHKHTEKSVSWSRYQCINFPLHKGVRFPPGDGRLVIRWTHPQWTWWPWGSKHSSSSSGPACLWSRAGPRCSQAESY